MNKGGIFYGISVIIGVAGVLAGVLLGLSETNFFVTLQTWTIAAILTLVFIFSRTSWTAWTRFQTKYPV